MLGIKKMLFISLIFIVNSPAFATDKMVLGYFRDWGIYSPNFHVNDIDASKLTHLIYESATLDKSGNIVLGDEYADTLHFYEGEEASVSGSLGQLILLKKRFPNLKTLIAIGGWNRSEHFSEVASNAQKRANFVLSIVEFINKYQFNGVEINWHNTAIHQTSVAWSASDKIAFTLLLKDLRTALDKQKKGYLLSTSPALSEQNIDSWQVKEVYEVVDFLNLRTEQQVPYDSPTSGFLSPLFSDEPTTINSINSIVSMIKKETNDTGKLVITIPSFALAFEGVKKSESLDVVGQPIGVASRGSWDVSDIHTGLYSRRHLNQYLNESGYLRFWHKETQSAYLYNTSKKGGHFISFEDQQSIEAKVSYVNKHQLAGIAISQLHSDNQKNSTVLAQVYAGFHPWLAYYNKIKAYYHEYQNTVYLFVSILILLVIAFVIFNLKSKKALKQQLQAESEFNALKDNLQQLNVPLEESLRLIQAMPKHILASLPQDSAAKATLSFIHKMAMINQQLLQETKLGDGLRTPNITHFLVNELLQNVLETFQCHNENRVLTMVNQPEQIMFNGDELYLQQILLMVLNLVWQRNNQSQPIFLSFDKIDDNLVVEISESDAQQSMLMLSDLMAARKLVNHLNGRFIVEYTPSLSIRLLIPNAKVVARKDARQIEQIKSGDYLNVITSFTADSLQMTNVEQLIEHAVFLLNHKQAEGKVAVLHGEKGLLFNQKSKPGEYFEVAKLLDYSFVVFDEKDHHGQLATCIHALVGQINMVRQQVHQLASTPRLLSELYDISSNKEKLDYIKAEKGYSGLYIKGKKDPVYVTLRLRVIKQYFDDLALLHVHRSYLVNPNKVLKAKQLSAFRYELQLTKISLPIGRSYVELLKRKYPHWFE